MPQVTMKIIKDQMEKAPEGFKRLVIYVEAMTTKDGSKKFNVYRTITKTGKKMQVKFRKEVTPPTETSFIDVETSNMNIDKSSVYKTLWIKDIEEVYDVQDVLKDYEEVVDETINEEF